MAQMPGSTSPHRLKFSPARCRQKAERAASRSHGGFRLRQTSRRGPLRAALGYVGQVRLRQTNPQGQLPATLRDVGPAEHVA